MLDSRIAERVGRRVAAFQPDLVRAVIRRLYEKLRVKTDPAFRSRVELRHPASDARGIKLFVPCGIEEFVKYTRLPSRLTSTICGPPRSGWAGLEGCGLWRTMPPSAGSPIDR